MNVLALACNLLHDTETKLKNETGFIILSLKTLDLEKQQAFLKSGARLVLIGPIQDLGPKTVNAQWKDCIFSLEMHQKIVYLDADMTLIRKTALWLPNLKISNFLSSRS